MVEIWLCVVLCAVTLCIAFLLGVAFVMLASLISERRDIKRKHDAFDFAFTHATRRTAGRI